METETQLVHFDAAKRELALASSLDEIKLVRDKAEALRQYIRQQGASLEMQNQAAEIKIRAERRAGEMLGEMDLAAGGEYYHNEPTGNIVLPVPLSPKLEELGITKIQSHRWQSETSVPEEILEQHIAEVKSKGEELTSIGVIRLAARLKRKEYIDEVLTLPTEKYRTLVVDPPWPMQKIERDVQMHTPAQVQMDYPVWDIERIRDLPLPADDQCHLYLWTTHRFLPNALDILEYWGFAYCLTFVWHKNGGFKPFNLPQYNCEFALFAKKGNIDFLDTKDFFTCFSADRTGHSRKPKYFYDMVNRVSPAPRLDMFSREKHEGFDQYGNEPDKF